MHSEANLKIKYFIILLLILTVSARAQNAPPKQRTIALSNPDKPYELDMKLYQGKIKVTGYEGRHIIMETEGKAGFRSDEKDNRVTISTEIPNDDVMVTLKVPRNKVVLKLGILNKGAVDVADVTGEVEIENVNGSITLKGISGSALATTVTGNILVTFKSVASNTPMAFSTLTGTIDITYPPATNASIRLKADNGKISSDFNITTGLQQPNKKQPSTTKPGSAEWQYIKINGGGAETLIRNMFGNISVRRAQ